MHDLLRDLGQDIAKNAETHFVNDIIAEAIIRKNRVSYEFTCLIVN